ncbi:AAA family ATPase [Spiribacter onubensis]|uniref:AAA family ATPase n=1 Tax=Spiribacter onubensis TaxID=3122420 RepID=A0ABV3S726_9GAMM
MNTFREINAMLCRNAESVCDHLLPNGRVESGEFAVGSIHGEAGKSLRVTIRGDRAGLWIDHANQDDRGDLLELWSKVRGVSIREAADQACTFLGVQSQPIDYGRKSNPVEIKRPAGIVSAQSSDQVMDWLTKERRISPETISKYRIASKNGAVVLPSLGVDGSVQYIKYRSITEKKYWSERGAVACLFGWQGVSTSAREIVLCEGEMDALAWDSYGYPALSPTNGANSLDWIETEYDNLARFDRIYLSWDMDDAGQSALPKIVERLGIERCFRIDLPHKDANECLIQGVDTFAIDSAVNKAATFDPVELVSAADYADSVVELFHGQSKDVGVTMPWRYGKGVILRRGEISLMAGINGHGKSEMAGMLALQAMEQGERVLVASMEFKPQKWIMRLTRQASALQLPSEDYIRAIHDWYQGRLWAFTATGTAKADRIIEVCQYALKRYGVRYFVIDNLAKCGFAEDDYNSQKKFVDRLTDFARDHDCHVQLCVHMRKSDTEDKVAGKFDVKGTGALTDMADTVFSLWRNKPKEEDRRLSSISGEPFDESEKPDAILKCVKQRNGDEEPSFALWFEKGSHQFIESHNAKPHRYVQFMQAVAI